MNKGILIATFCLLLLTGFLGCHHRTGQVKVIPRDSMIEVLADLHIADAADHVAPSPAADINTLRRDANFGWVMKKHNITFQQFDSSFKYYLGQAELFSKMYDVVINRIKEKEAENQRSPQEEAVRRDSLRKDSIHKIELQKVAHVKDSLRNDSIQKANLKAAAAQKAAFKKDSIQRANQKKADYRKESTINEQLKKSLNKGDTLKTKKDSVKRKKILKKLTDLR